jgi:hypothetical protein
MIKNARKRRYWANPGGDDGLRNGSFVRERIKGKGLVQWMNGDCMGLILEVPEGFTEVDQEHAERLIPECCK